jgi:hypothetical protein
MIEMSAHCKKSDAPYIQSIVKHSDGAYFLWSYSVMGSFFYCIKFPTSKSYQEFNKQFDMIFYTTYSEKNVTPIKKVYNKIVGRLKYYLTAIKNCV